MNSADIAERIASCLQLKKQPIALALVEEPPKGIDQATDRVPSACAFWIRAEKGTFFARAEHHFNCPVGAMVMGFTLPDAINAELMTLVRRMCDCNYLCSDEAPKIPFVSKAKAGIVYGLLKDFPIEPDVLLFWINPKQLMIFCEAAGISNWLANAESTSSGRPACAVIPLAIEKNQTAISLGCVGMRTFTGVGDDLVLAAIPSQQASEFLGRLEITIRANATMEEFYESRRVAFA
jgi:uncharacterized protein (DUF169 family)